MKISLTAKQRATLSALADGESRSAFNLGQMIYDNDPDNYENTVMRLGLGAYTKIGTDRTRELLKAGLVDRDWDNYKSFRYRITDRGLAALEGRAL